MGSTFRASIVAAALGLSLVSPSPAPAALITFDFTADITSVDAALGPTIDTTQTISGSFTYDDTTAASANPNSSTTRYDGALTTVSASIGALAWSLTTGLNFVQISDDFTPVVGATRDILNATSEITGSMVNSLDPVVFVLQLTDLTANAFNNQALVPSLDLADFTDPLVTLVFEDSFGASRLVEGTVTSLVRPSQIPIPEPGSLALFGIGLIGLGALRRRQVSAAG